MTKKQILIIAAAIILILVAALLLTRLLGLWPDWMIHYELILKHRLSLYRPDRPTASVGTRSIADSLADSLTRSIADSLTR